MRQEVEDVIMYNRTSNKRSNTDLAIGLAQALAAAWIVRGVETKGLESDGESCSPGWSRESDARAGWESSVPGVGRSCGAGPVCSAVAGAVGDVGLGSHRVQDHG